MHVVSVSGGKDSTATLLLALQRVGRASLRAIFCDTGNEHEDVYTYLTYLEHTLHITITRLKADFADEIARKRAFIARDQRSGRRNGRKLRWTNKAKRRALAVLHPTGNPYLDLCLWKGRFPSRRTQFCTHELKRDIAVAYQTDLIDAGYRVVSWQGVRRDESVARRFAKKGERVSRGLWIFRPLVNWTAAEVFGYCARMGVRNNPLYTKGMGRVGCMPCINAGKGELRQIGTRFPTHISRIADWERLVAQASKRGISTFFAAPGRSDQQAAKRTVDIVIQWAHTTRGGHSLAEPIESVGCSSAYGLCE
jgi:3'-phosphoadenosine 5'-phosphosulfate sulfotransferase (PAPS reductase)/FAD synthetase